IVILIASVTTSHAVARIENRFGLGLLTGLHQLAAAIWLGGLPYLLLSLRRAEDKGAAGPLSRRFSRLAVFGVAILGGAGTLLSICYIDTLNAVYGTAYGVMVISKVVLFAMLIALGALNFFIVRKATTDPSSLSSRLRHFAEAEIGIGFTAILAAASLTS